MATGFFFLLLCATNGPSEWLCLLTGLEGLKVLHDKMRQAAVGQSIRLPCIFNGTVEISISQIEWRRQNPDTRLVVHHKQFGTHSNNETDQDVKCRAEMDDSGQLMGLYLYLGHVRVNDSGTYVCELTTYPFGSVSKQTHLIVKGIL